MHWDCHDEPLQPGSSCTAKSVVGRSDDRDAGTVVGASTALMTMDVCVQFFVLSKCMDIEQVGRSNLGGIPRVVVSDNAWDIRDFVHVCVCTSFIRGSMACVHGLLEEVCILPTEGLHWDAHELRDQIYEVLFGPVIVMLSCTLVGFRCLVKACEVW